MINKKLMAVVCLLCTQFMAYAMFLQYPAKPVASQQAVNKPVAPTVQETRLTRAQRRESNKQQAPATTASMPTAITPIASAVAQPEEWRTRRRWSLPSARDVATGANEDIYLEYDPFLRQRAVEVQALEDAEMLFKANPAFVKQAETSLTKKGWFRNTKPSAGAVAVEADKLATQAWNEKMKGITLAEQQRQDQLKQQATGYLQSSYEGAKKALTALKNIGTAPEGSLTPQELEQALKEERLLSKTAGERAAAKVWKDELPWYSLRRFIPGEVGRVTAKAEAARTEADQKVKTAIEWRDMPTWQKIIPASVVAGAKQLSQDWEKKRAELEAQAKGYVSQKSAEAAGAFKGKSLVPVKAPTQTVLQAPSAIQKLGGTSVGDEAYAKAYSKALPWYMRAAPGGIKRAEAAGEAARARAEQEMRDWQARQNQPFWRRYAPESIPTAPDGIPMHG